MDRLGAREGKSWLGTRLKARQCLHFVLEHVVAKANVLVCSIPEELVLKHRVDLQDKDRVHGV